MIRRTVASLVAAATLIALAAVAPAVAGAADAPAWKLTVASLPTNLAPNQALNGSFPAYYIVATNIGAAPTSGPVTIEDTLPSGLTPTALAANCKAAGRKVTCKTGSIIRPGRSFFTYIFFNVGPLPDPSTLVDKATVLGGGAPSVTASTTTPLTAALPDFGFTSGEAGLSASLTDPDGAAATQAGAHPYQFTIDVGFKTRILSPEEAEQQITGAGGGLRSSLSVLPAGMIANPLATPHCTEAQLELHSCPTSSAVGIFVGSIPSIALPTPSISPLYNMVPTPGVAATLGTDAGGLGIFVHFQGGLRAGDYTIVSTTDDILARAPNPVTAVQVQLWSDSTDPAHDYVRGECAYLEGANTCLPPVGYEQTIPFLSLPTHCTSSLLAGTSVEGWAEPGVRRELSVPLADSQGEISPVEGCDNPELKFNPTLIARPTTNVADAPSGLEADLHIPQTNDLSELSTPHLRKAVVTLPPGLVLNPASANGLAACSSAQIGIDPASGLANGSDPTCPDAAKIGTVEVQTPLLDHPIPGAVYVAAPHDNPFDSLLAIYVVFADPGSGTLIKLAGHVIPDPANGQLTTVFDENPQLPFTEFKLDFFGGPGAPLRTPPTCATYSTTSQMTPWSAPQSGPPATPSDSFAIGRSPNGSCAKEEASLPNSPSFDAGSVSLIAGHYTPFVMNLKRGDDTQQFASLTLNTPKGLAAKLAGTPYCSEAALTAAARKTGAGEKASPSCPVASQVGTVEVGAGAGPAPYYTTGKAYLAGPYKGAPLSLAIITPAVAGPYDLGTVLVRNALRLDPETAQVTAVSDPIPQILQGVPLDIRSIALKLDKPDFTLNPTSCDRMSISGQLLSSLGQPAALQNPFQVAECARLGFKPSLSLRLKGGTKRNDHPALTAVLTYPKGNSANIAKASVALPHSEFLDQSHIGTICTRVQFAAGACPKASIYGTATAITPLLDQPLSGPVYLRSSSNPLPDLVADLNGQIHVVLAGRVDSVKGGIRNSFEAVPDAPVSKFVLKMAGGKKGLLVNSRDICKQANKATALFDAQNGKTFDSKPVLKADCKAKGKKKHPKHGRG